MNFYKRKHRTPTVIIVSLIDIFAILLIFVIVTTTFKRAQPSIAIKLPESSNSETDPKTGNSNLTLLTITPEGGVALGDLVIKRDDEEWTKLEEWQPLVKAISQGGDHQHIALNADKKAPFGVVVRVLDALKEAGVKGNLPAFTEMIDKKRE